jgi:GT2 family glycosyltransferase
MFLSIIIPVHNGSNYLRECLSALQASVPAQSEIIVVDDASQDNSVAVARDMGVCVLQLSENAGPAGARNFGARRAQGDVLFFLDADVVVASWTLARVQEVLQRAPDVAAVFGSYDDNPRAPGVISQYRNLLHHFVHQNGNPEASTFWAGCGAIRRNAFEDVGGFDEKRFRRPAIEDIELGYRLRQKGYRILLDKTLQATHLKRWNLPSLVRTDITCRAVPWARLIFETKHAPDDLNLELGQRLSFALVAIGLACLAFALVEPKLVMLASACLAATVMINHELYKFFIRRRGVCFAAGCIPLHLLYYVYSGLSFLYVAAEFRLRKFAIVRPTQGY